MQSYNLISKYQIEIFRKMMDNIAISFILCQSFKVVIGTTYVPSALR